MRKSVHDVFLTCAVAFMTALLLALSPARAQVSGGPNVNTSKMPGDQTECAMAKNPTNKFQLFVACNVDAGGALFAARSIDNGATWIYPDPSKTIANGNPGLGQTPACCDPSVAWDNFGNLFVAYVDSSASFIVLLLSTDSGQTFTQLTFFGPEMIDQPTVVADAGQVWVVWNQNGSMVARGAAVTGLGAANIGPFIALQNIPGTSSCNFGDIAIAPSGAVVQVCQSPISMTLGPTSLLVNIKPDGLGPKPFGSAITATSTNVSGFYSLPAQDRRLIDAEASFAFDRNPLSPHFGRLYLVYTDAPSSGSVDTDIFVRFSDDNGATWSARIRVNDDNSGRSQFLPRIFSNPRSGNIAVCWHDARNSSTNTAMEEFCSIATPSGASPTFMANAQIGAALSTSSLNEVQFGDYSGLVYHQGFAHPVWGDTSNSTGDNPDGTSAFDVYTARVTGGAAGQEGTLFASHDFNGDGRSDILWRGGAGNTAAWLMNGGQIVQGAVTAWCRWNGLIGRSLGSAISTAMASTICSGATTSGTRRFGCSTGCQLPRPEDSAAYQPRGRLPAPATSMVTVWATFSGRTIPAMSRSG
jgi:hypothetical protein